MTTRVFAVPGAPSDALADQARRASSWRPTSVVVVIGANDLLHHTHAGLVPVLRAASMLLRDSQVIAARAAGAHVADRDHATRALSPPTVRCSAPTGSTPPAPGTP